jgi:hypothetical protein
MIKKEMPEGVSFFGFYRKLPVGGYDFFCTFAANLNLKNG